MQYPRQLKEWRDIEGFPGMLIDEDGAVLNDWSCKILTPRTNRQGILMIGMMREGRQQIRSVALLVAHAFLDPPKNDAYNSVIHLNGDKEDCRAINLMWRPRWYVVEYHRMFNELPKRVAVYIPRLDRVFPSLREFCTTYGLIESHTYVDMLNGTPCFHYGWVIERFENFDK